MQGLLTAVDVAAARITEGLTDQWLAVSVECSVGEQPEQAGDKTGAKGAGEEEAKPGLVEKAQGPPSGGAGAEGPGHGDGLGDSHAGDAERFIGHARGVVVSHLWHSVSPHNVKLEA